ncbi:MAG: hypothetical protein CL609_13160 [Anaerolineaceae bacterium]|nr:hypothetical protein [Anaerolineaceae bacterium]
MKNSITNKFQRKGSRSNAHVGKEFEKIAKRFFLSQGLHLDSNYKIEIGVSQIKKDHVFDLGSDNPKIIVECKSHRWTETDKIPSAKRTVWNEAMFYFFITPKEYRKIFFVLKHFSQKWNETLASHYVRLNAHLIPHGVEIWEYDEEIETALKIY